ncbi:MAG: 7TM domain-containing protein [Bacteroidota bacterium]
MKIHRLTAYALIIISSVVVVMKIVFWDYSFKKFLPKTRYEVTCTMSFEGFSDPITISTYLPQSDGRQSVSEETNNSPSLEFRIEQSQRGRLGVWESGLVNGRHQVMYHYNFLGSSLKYIVDTSLVVKQNYPRIYTEYLEATPDIQVNHPRIRKIYQEVVGSEQRVYHIVSSIQEYTGSLISRPFKGVTDALTAARLGEASCNGKSRLFVALARSAHIPSRLVGGLILENGTKTTSHQWVEVYISGEWVPFDPLNGHFAYVPYNYVALYRGDEFLFSHTPNINFDYSFTIKSRLNANPLLFSELRTHPFNAYRLWEAFDNIGVPIGLLKIILLLPLGAVIVAIFRNVIGLNTFGVFLPALIAVASRETGLWYGLFAYLLVIGIVSIVHIPLQKWGILYTPKLVIMLVCVVILFLLISYFAIGTGMISLAYITLFPIVVLTISAERFARKIEEDGYMPALLITLQTLVVVVFAYYAMNSRSMEALFLAFPEVFLVIIGINLLLGRWIGLRMIEYFRFRTLI